MRADGEATPTARDFETLKQDLEFIEDSADAIIAMGTPKTSMAAAE